MDLYFNTDACLTKHIVAKRLLSTPFVLVDVGVLGGEHPRWHVLGDCLVVHGFDAAEPAVQELRQTTAANRHYSWAAIGEADGEREFFYSPDSPGGSTFIPVGRDRYSSQLPRYRAERVPMRSLDTLLASGEIPQPDFLKVDVEGFEIAVFRGAKNCLASGISGVEFETSFNVGPDYPHSHLGSIQEVLIPAGYRLHDIAFERQVCETFADASRSAGRALYSGVGRPTTLNVLFCRESIAPNADQVMKQIIVHELHGLIDVAFDLTVTFERLIASRMDPQMARRLLLASSRRLPRTQRSSAEEVATLKQRIKRLGHQNLGWRAHMRDMHTSTSWRLTAPLRALKNWLVTGRDRDDAAVEPTRSDTPVETPTPR